MMPNGWQHVKIGDIADIKVGRDVKESSFSEIKNEDYIYPVYSNTVENRGLYGYYNFQEHTGNCLTIVGRGIGLGTAFARHNNFGAIGRLLILYPINNSFDVDFFENYVNFILRIYNESGGIPQLPGSQIAKYKVFLPPIKEQNKISKILTTWDKSIDVTEKLIQNSQTQKKALMQQLLTGGKRLSGFNQKWQAYKLEEICKFLKGKGLSKDEVGIEGEYKCILYGELYTYYNEVITGVKSRTNVNDGLKSVSGDVLIPCSTTTTSIDLANAVSINENSVLLGGDINVLRTNKRLVNSNFLAYLLTHTKKHDIARLAQGITIIHLYGRDLKNISVNLPPINEQEKIISILASADLKIKQLKQNLNYLQGEKKALMQQLLTGKRRVKVDKSDEVAA